jgi:hypothetical protein
MLTELLLLDIETVPQYPSYTDMDPGWQVLFFDKISKTVPEGKRFQKLIVKKRAFLQSLVRSFAFPPRSFMKMKTSSWP